MYVVESLEQVRNETEKWLEIYNHKRPHDSLRCMPSSEYLHKHNPDLPHLGSVLFTRGLQPFCFPVKLNGSTKRFRIERNNAENRVRNMANNGWKTSFKTTVSLSNDTEVSTDEAIDLERLARD